MLVIGVSDQDRPRSQLVSFTPGREEGEVAGVAHYGRVPSGWCAPSLMEGKLNWELHRDACSEEGSDRGLERLAGLDCSDEKLGASGGGNDIGRHASPNQPEIEGRLPQQ